jgi:hypothetical protein
MKIVLALCVIALIAAVGLASSPVAQKASGAAQQDSLPVQFAFGGNAAEIPAEFVDNLVLLPVRVGNGQPSLFLLDSTAARSSIAPSRAAELGFAPGSSATLVLHGMQISFSALPAVANDNFAAQTGRRYQGTLGHDFLASVIVEIDYGRQTLRLYDPASYKYSGGGTSFPLKFAAGLPLIPAKINLPHQKAREGEFIVDTSLAASVVIAEQFAESRHLFAAHLKTIKASDPRIHNGENIVIGRPKEIQIGPHTIEGAVAAFSPSPAGPSGSEIAGAIGGGILKRFSVVFDFAHQQLILTPNLRMHELEEEDKSGLSIVAKGPGWKQFEIDAILPGTPAANAGIKTGDVIAGIDEDPSADLTLIQVRELFRQPDHKYKLTIERGGQTLQVSFQTRRLL